MTTKKHGQFSLDIKMSCEESESPAPSFESRHYNVSSMALAAF
jgi:hypothetical protein